MTKHQPQHVSRVLPAGQHGLPLVAIVGRPNVGKSTLFNRLARRRLAIVHDEPGVTRDRNYADTTAFGRDYTLVDTGGFDPDSDDPMKSGITRHVKSAIEEADVIVFVSDALVPLTSADRVAVGLLRKTDKPVLFAANKADSPRQDADAYDIYRLGVDKVFPVSGLHGRGMAELEGAIIAAMPANKEVDTVDEFLARAPRATPSTPSWGAATSVTSSSIPRASAARARSRRPPIRSSSRASARPSRRWSARASSSSSAMQRKASPSRTRRSSGSRPIAAAP